MGKLSHWTCIKTHPTIAPRRARTHDLPPAYLGKREQALQEGSLTHQLHRFRPARLRTRLLGVARHRRHLALEQQQDAVHDAHDEVRRVGQLTHCNTRWREGWLASLRTATHGGGRVGWPAYALQHTVEGRLTSLRTTTHGGGLVG